MTIKEFPFTRDQWVDGDMKGVQPVSEEVIEAMVGEEDYFILPPFQIEED